VVPALHPHQPDTGVGLGVQVHEKDTFSLFSEACGNVDDATGFANASLVIDESYFSNHRYSCDCHSIGDFPQDHPVFCDHRIFHSFLSISECVWLISTGLILQKNSVACAGMSECLKTARIAFCLAVFLATFSGVFGSLNGASSPQGEESIVLYWKDLERVLMEYRFDELLRPPLEDAYARDVMLTVMIRVGPDCPIWLFYKRDVPRLYTDRKVDEQGKRVRRLDNRFPYYLDPVYKEAFYDLINAFGTYVANLPPKLRERIAAIQSCEGFATDTVPYKGNPEKEEYAISVEDWEEYRLQTWKLYSRNFPGTPIMVNTGSSVVAWTDESIEESSTSQETAEE
jgi:hypothetical protein